MRMYVSKLMKLNKYVKQRLDTYKVNVYSNIARRYTNKYKKDLKIIIKSNKTNK